MTKEELVERVRARFELVRLWQFLGPADRLRMPQGFWIDFPVPSPFRPDDPARTFTAKTSMTWIDHRDGSTGDAFGFLCRLRKCDPDKPSPAVIEEFLSLAVTAELITPAELAI